MIGPVLRSRCSKFAYGKLCVFYVKLESVKLFLLCHPTLSQIQLKWKYSYVNAEYG